MLQLSCQLLPFKKAAAEVLLIQQKGCPSKYKEDACSMGLAYRTPWLGHASSTDFQLESGLLSIECVFFSPASKCFDEMRENETLKGIRGPVVSAVSIGMSASGGWLLLPVLQQLPIGLLEDETLRTEFVTTVRDSILHNTALNK